MARTQHSSTRADSTVRGREIMGIVLLAVGLFLQTALLSLQLGSGELMGPLGRLCARTLHAGAGMASNVVTLTMVLLPIRLLAGRRLLRSFGEGAGILLGLVSGAVLLHLVSHDVRIHGYAAGGLLGETLAEILRASVSTAGTALGAGMGLALALVPTTRRRSAAVIAWQGVIYILIEAGRFCLEVMRAILPERSEAHELEGAEAARAPMPAREKRRALPASTVDGDDDTTTAVRADDTQPG